MLQNQAEIPKKKPNFLGKYLKKQTLLQNTRSDEDYRGYKVIYPPLNNHPNRNYNSIGITVHFCSARFARPIEIILIGITRFHACRKHTQFQTQIGIANSQFQIQIGIANPN